MDIKNIRSIEEQIDCVPDTQTKHYFIYKHFINNVVNILDSTEVHFTAAKLILTTLSPGVIVTTWEGGVPVKHQQSYNLKAISHSNKSGVTCCVTKPKVCLICEKF